MIGLALVVFVAAVYTVAGIGMNMSALTMTKMAIEMPGMAMQPAVWSIGYGLVIFLMWWVMMVAMMVPSAAPLVLIHAAIGRKQEKAGQPLAATALFVAGYLAVWAIFSLIATALQWALESMGILTGMMEIASPTIAGLVLIAAGLYQLTPFKKCLSQTLPEPIDLYPSPLAARQGWCIPNGDPAWWLLPRLLLVLDGSSVRWGDHEPHLDSRHRPLCGHRKVCRRAPLDNGRCRRDTDGSRASYGQ